jgi:HEAT repeat protein
MSRGIRWIFALAVVVGLAAPAAAQTTDDMKATVETMLGGFEKPAADDEWQALGAAAVPYLLSFAGDGALPRSTRARAVAALGNFPAPEVVTFLCGLLAPGGDDVLQRKALRALARTAGAEQLALIAGYLAHDSSVLRESAAHALGLVGTAEARSALEGRRAVETSTAVQKAIDEELAR